MNSVKKLLLIVAAVGSFAVAAYNLVWAPDWQVVRWPEVRLRSAYVTAQVSAALDFAGHSDASMINSIQAYDSKIEQKLFVRLLLSLGIACGVTVGLALIPALVGSGKEGGIRGARLATVGELRRRITWHRYKRHVLLLALYVGGGMASGWLFFHSPIAVGAALFIAVALFVSAEYLSKGTLTQRPGVSIGGVQIPEEMEGRHFLVCGSTGAGKSLLIYQMILDARRRQDRGFVLDIGGACYRRFGRRGDLLLAPGDPKSVKWNPFLEIRNRFDFLELARAAIPDGTGEGQGFHDMARVLLATVMEKMYNEGDFSISRLLFIVCASKKEELNQIVDGTPADVYTQDGGERLLQSVRSVLTTYLVAWQFIEDNGDFSVRDWTRKAQAGQWLFVRYSDGQVTVLRQLLASWLKLAISETIGDDEHIPPPTWFVADEFDSLGAVSAARDALSKLRRYGGRCVLGVQTVAQLWATYGRDIATVLLSCLSHQVYLRAGDPETAEYCSKALGDHEFLRQEQSRSRRGLLGLGGDPSKTDAERHTTERIVLPSEILSLPDRVGYLNVAGAYPVAKIKIPIPPTEKRI